MSRTLLWDTLNTCQGDVNIIRICLRPEDKETGQLMTDKEGVTYNYSHNLSRKHKQEKQRYEIMSSIVYQCNVDALCTCVVSVSLHTSDLKRGPGELQWGLCFLACLLRADIFHNLSWLMVWKHFFQWDGETANVLEGCHGAARREWSSLLRPNIFLFFFFS